MSVFRGLFGKKSTGVGNSNGSMCRYDLGRTGFITSQSSASVPQRIAWEYQCETNLMSSPVVAENTLFLLTKEGSLHALDAASGSLKWKLKTDWSGDYCESSPAVADGFVYFMSEDRLYAVNITNGKVKWTFKTHKESSASPIVYDHKVFFGSWGRFHAVDMTRGKEIWRAETGCSAAVFPLVDKRNGVVCVAAGSEVFALDIQTGVIHRKWSFHPGGNHILPVTASDGLLFVGIYSHRGLTVIEVATGTVREFILGSELWQPVAIAKSCIYALDLYGIEAWQLSQPSFEVSRVWSHRFEDSCVASPTIVGNAVLLSLPRYIYAFDTTSGKELWTYDIGVKNNIGIQATAPLIVDEERLYFTTNDGTVVALS